MATKYIDAEKLKAVIKRQKHELELSIQSQGDYGQSCHIVAYDNILSLIASLQQEQPEVDLEEEMEKVGANWPFPASFDGYAKEWVDGLMEECAKHFYELGLNARKEE